MSSSRTVTVKGKTRALENQGVTLVEAPTLDALGNTIRHEIDLAQRAATKALEHAVAAGEALCAAKLRVPRGTWGRWLKEQNIVPSTAATYMRIADFRDALAGRGVTTVNEAKQVLRDSGMRFTIRYDGELTYEIRKLLDEGATQGAVAEKLGISRRSVSGRLRDAKRGSRKVGGHNRRKVQITDTMIEGMAIWLCEREAKPLTDAMRAAATEALRTAVTWV